MYLKPRKMLSLYFKESLIENENIDFQSNLNSVVPCKKKLGKSSDSSPFFVYGPDNTYYMHICTHNKK